MYRKMPSLIYCSVENIDLNIEVSSYYIIYLFYEVT